MNNLASQLEAVNTVAILGHVNPDGDCVGSCLAVWNYIKKWFPQISADVYLEQIPDKFSFLSGAREIKHDFSIEKSYDLCIILDCGDIYRLGGAAHFFTAAKKTVCIDHHVSSQGIANENYIFPTVSSASELVFDLLEEERVTKEIAECIYIGMIHDTGMFQYDSTSSKTMNIAGKLMDKGIAFTEIVDQTFYTKTYEQQKITGKVLAESKLLLENKCIVGVVTKEDMRKYHVLPKHLGGIISQLRVTKNVQIAIFLYEIEEGFKASLRSNGKVNVAEICTKFGGGGHVRAAGASMKGTAHEIIEKLCTEIKEQL